jgi:serine/threonine protein kinase
MQQLKGMCWDVRPSLDERVTVQPVLVMEKTEHGDLGHFIPSERGRNLPFHGKLMLCLDIGEAIYDLHSSKIIHGDIKPGKILVSEDQEGNLSAKLSDFGHSAVMGDGDSSLAYLPESQPGCAPEYHRRGFEFQGAASMDIFSYGMVTLWMLFYNSDLDYPGRGLFHSLKINKSLLGLAKELLDRTISIPDTFKPILASFFEKSLGSTARSRASAMEQLLLIINEDWQVAPE